MRVPPAPTGARRSEGSAITEQTIPGAGARSSRLFAFLLLVSGFCGISYEILYARLLGNLIGDQFAVIAAILLTFLLGIGFGTLFAHRLWRWLWLLEAGVGACGLAFAFGTGPLDRLLYAAVPVVGRGLGASIFVCFLLLCAPAFLIGTSLPLFAGYLARLNPGRVFARAYMIYNFGAAITALLIEFVLLRLTGLRLAVVFMASLNFFVAAVLLLRFAPLRGMRPRPAEAARFPARHLVALATASLGSAVFQLLMVKIAECLLGPFRETFALVLALILLGIAAGSAVTERLRLTFTQVLAFATGGLIFLLAAFPLVSRLYAVLLPAVVQVTPHAMGFKLAVLAILMGVPAMGFGATIPALLTTQRNVARESGQLLFVSSVANAAGFMLMAFVLHRHLAYGTIVLAVVALTAAALVIGMDARGRKALGAVGAVVLAAFVHFAAWDENLLYVGHTSFHSLADLRDARRKMQRPEIFKGYQDVFSITWSDGKPWFFINGYVSISLTSPTERLVGAFTSVFAPRTDKALILGLGSGATAGTVSLLFDRTDAVEINPVVLENLFRMAPYNFDVENQPGVNVIQDDAIHYVKTSDEKYSMIINTVTTPLYFSSSKLYTKEFLESVRERLEPDGIYMTWMDSRVGDRGAAIILRTVTDAFDDCWIGAIQNAYFLLICSQGELKTHDPGLVASNETLSRFFFGEHTLPPEWIPYGLLSTQVHEIAGRVEAEANTLDYPALEFEMARSAHRREGVAKFGRRLLEAMSLEDVGGALSGMEDFDPMDLVLYSEILIGEERELPARWRNLASARIDEFDDRYAALRIDYQRKLLEAAGTPAARFDYASALLDAGRYEDAVREYRLTLAADPTQQRAHLNIGYAFDKLGDYAAALEQYALEEKLSPEDPDVPYHRGITFMRQGRYVEALGQFDEALARDDRANTRWCRGQALEGLGRVSEARAAYESALDLEPENAEALRALERLGGAARRGGS